MNKKNVLFVLPTLPWPLSSGGNQAMYNGIIALADVANIYITFPYYAHARKDKESEDFLKEMNGQVRLFPFLAGGDAPLWRKLASHLHDTIEERVLKTRDGFRLDKVITIRQVPQKKIEFVNHLINEHKIDIVQVEMMQNLTIVNSLPAHVRKVFVHHELGYVKNAQLLDGCGANEYYRSKLESYKIEEIGLLNKYDDVIVLSDIDRQKLQQEGVRVPVHSSFAVVKAVEVFKPQIEDCHNLVFIGSPKHTPNYIGVTWFLENCWDKLLSIDGSYKLKFIGFWDKDKMGTISGKYRNIVFTGFVDNLAAELKDGIMIVPITVGSGIRMKILEAANYGIPVVSTSIGAEGLPLKDGENAFIADDTDTFVEDILKLKDKELRLKFVNELGCIVRKDYSLEALKQNRCEVLGL